ncbi:MAG: GIY-YIG nuclease family protein [Saprospiraceae bacterium]|nr:GIY-YIG nuclease family protein [Saprospiraceae bacterium]
MKSGFVYIMTNKNRTTTYIGVTSNLHRRVLEHKARVVPSFTKRYNLLDLIYFEEFDSIIEAIAREKQLKNWHKEWKWNQIKSTNPELKDIAQDWYSKNDIEECIAILKKYKEDRKMREAGGLFKK